MSIVPRTLQARIVLLMLLLLTVGQYAALRLFDHFELEPRAVRYALQIVSTVKLTRLAVLAARDDRRLELLQELNQSEGVRISPFDPLEAIEPLPGVNRAAGGSAACGPRLGARPSEVHW